MVFEFYKWEALGNDFIIIEGASDNEFVSHIKNICHRRLGIGADGLIFLDCSVEIPIIHFYNADGSQASMCGNGLRCCMLHLQKKNRPLVIEFSGKIYNAFYERDRLYVMMPLPEQLSVINPPYEGIWVKAGVPHFLIKKENVHEGVLQKEVFDKRYSPCFGESGTNITFYNEQGATFFLRTCERGVDEETLSCGSAAVACSYLSDLLELEMVYPSGRKAYIKKYDSKVFLAGEATLVFVGKSHFIKENAINKAVVLII